MTAYDNPPLNGLERRQLRADLLTVEEAAQRMGTPPRFVRRLIAERRIRFCHIGRYVRLASEDVDEFIDGGWVEAVSRSHRPHRR